MTEPTQEFQTPTERLQAALVAFTGAIGDSLDGICSYSLTIGEDYVPFDPDPEDDCEDGEAACSQAWVRVDTITPVVLSEGFDGNACASSMQIALEAGVLRCLEVAEGGEAPTASEVLACALQSIEDMNAMLCAAMSTEVWEAIDAVSWTPTGPLGGQYGGVWTFTVEV